MLMAFAAGDAGSAAPLSEHEILVLLVQLVLLIGLARILGGLFKRAGQPAVVGELLAGVILGPSFFGKIAPGAYEWVFGDAVVQSVVFALAWIGVIFLLIVIGYETDLGIISRYRAAAGWVSAGGLLVPIAVMLALAFAVPSSFVGDGVDRRVFAGFFALALSVSALPVVAKILYDLGLMRRTFGQITLASGMLMDAVGWLILAALTGIALDGFQPELLALSFGGLLIFVVLVVTTGRWLIDRVMRVVLDRGSSVTAALTVSVIAAFIGAVVTQALQLEAILGAFIVGILLASTRHQLPEVRRTLETVTAALFAPIFFAFSGLRVDIGLLGSTDAILWCVGLFVVAVLAKMGGTLLGGRVGGIRGRRAWALGAGLSALGAMGIVVAIVALNLGVVSETGYTVLVIIAIATSLLAPQLLRWVVAGWPTPPDEAERLEREAMLAASEILGSRRILLPTRGGANTRYAASILSGVFHEPDLTVLAVDVPSSRMPFVRRDTEVADASGVDEELDTLAIPHRDLKVRSSDPVAAIARESRLGYDLLIIGATGQDEHSEGLFSSSTDRIIAGVDLPTIVVRSPWDGDGDQALPPRILVPVNAGRSSRAAEELAYGIARATTREVCAVHVVDRPDGQGVMFDEPGRADAQQAAHDMVGAAVAFGERFGIDVEGAVRTAPNAEEAIVDLANSGDFGLLVVGASNRPMTDRPFFGHRVHYILEHTRIPVAVVALPAPLSGATE